MSDKPQVKVDLQDLVDIIKFAQVRRGRDIRNGVDDDSHPIDEVIQRLATIASWHKED